MENTPNSAPYDAPEASLSHVDKDRFLCTDNQFQVDYRRRFSDHMASLQERQMEMVRQTAAEFEALKREYEQSKQAEETMLMAQQQPLAQEVQTLHAAVQELQQHNLLLEEQLRISQLAYRSQHEQLQGVVSGLKDIVRFQAQSFEHQLRTLAQETTQNMEGMLRTLEIGEQPPPEILHSTQFLKLDAVQVAAQPVSHEALAPVPVQQPEPASQPYQAPESLAARTASIAAHNVHSAPVVEAFVAPIATQPVLAKHEPVQYEQPTKVKKEKPVRIKKEKVRTPRQASGGLHKFAFRTVMVASVAVAGFSGWKILTHVQQQNIAASLASASGTVAGVSTDSSITGSSSTNEYPDAFVDLPYAQTQWATLTDSFMGISMQYPKNTSDRARPVGGNNLWIIRKNGFLMEFTEDNSATTLADWQTANQATLSQSYSIANGTFKNLPALVMTPLKHTITSGTQYAVVQNGFILIIWVKDEDPQSDDGQRVAYMLNSLTITTPTAQ